MKYSIEKHFIIQVSISYTIFQLLQPRSAIIFATVVDGTTEFSRTAFTAIQTADGPDGGVGIGAGIGGTG